jgi:hypothetical protein
MGRLTSLMRRVGLLVTRDRFRQELEEEMAFHRDEAERRFEAEGMSSQDARYAARREFGNATRLREQSHEASALLILSPLWWWSPPCSL